MMRLDLISQLFASITGKERGGRHHRKAHVDDNPHNTEPLEDNVTARWEALVRYDDEIRAAAERLRPFGEAWVSELGKAFFTLNEERKYLPNIVSRLMAEAEAAHEEEQRKLDLEQEERLVRAFRVTADGKLCSKESLDILRKALALGYKLEIQRDKAIAVTRPGNVSISYLLSNCDIQEFGRFEKLLFGEWEGR
jgi:hypothetical protein